MLSKNEKVSVPFLIRTSGNLTAKQARIKVWEFCFSFPPLFLDALASLAFKLSLSE